VHQKSEFEAELNPRKKFAFSMAAFLALALLSWSTMSNVPVPVHSTELGIDFSIDFRMVTLAILGLLATRTALSYWRATVEQRREAASKEK
jgi:hypothetical protein